MQYSQRRRRRMLLAAGASSNLLAPLSWTAGAVTTLSIAGGFARATATDFATANPRIFKGPLTLTPGLTYRVTGAVHSGPGSNNNRVRVGLTTALAADVTEQIFNGDTVVDFTFVAPASPVYVGLVAVVSGDTQWAEVADGLVLELD